MMYVGVYNRGLLLVFYLRFSAILYTKACMLLFCRRIIAEAERMARLNQQRKEEELAARMKRSTEGPAHHIVQVSACLAVVVLWSLVVIGISFDDATLMARLHLSVIFAIVVTSVCAISIVLAIAIFLFCTRYHA